MFYYAPRHMLPLLRDYVICHDMLAMAATLFRRRHAFSRHAARYAACLLRYAITLFLPLGVCYAAIMRLLMLALHIAMPLCRRYAALQFFLRHVTSRASACR